MEGLHVLLCDHGVLYVLLCDHGAGERAGRSCARAPAWLPLFGPVLSALLIKARLFIHKVHLLSCS